MLIGSLAPAEHLSTGCRREGHRRSETSLIAGRPARARAPRRPAYRSALDRIGGASRYPGRRSAEFGNGHHWSGLGHSICESSTHSLLPLDHVSQCHPNNSASGTPSARAMRCKSVIDGWRAPLSMRAIVTWWTPTFFASAACVRPARFRASLSTDPLHQSRTDDITSQVICVQRNLTPPAAGGPPRGRPARSDATATSQSRGRRGVIACLISLAADDSGLPARLRFHSASELRPASCNATAARRSPLHLGGGGNSIWRRRCKRQNCQPQKTKKTTKLNTKARSMTTGCPGGLST